MSLMKNEKEEYKKYAQQHQEPPKESLRKQQRMQIASQTGGEEPMMEQQSSSAFLHKEPSLSNESLVISEDLQDIEASDGSGLDTLSKEQNSDSTLDLDEDETLAGAYAEVSVQAELNKHNPNDFGNQYFLPTTSADSDASGSEYQGAAAKLKELTYPIRYTVKEAEMQEQEISRTPTTDDWEAATIAEIKRYSKTRSRTSEFPRLLIGVDRKIKHVPDELVEVYPRPPVVYQPWRLSYVPPNAAEDKERGSKTKRVSLILPDTEDIYFPNTEPDIKNARSTRRVSYHLPGDSLEELQRESIDGNDAASVEGNPELYKMMLRSRIAVQEEVESQEKAKRPSAEEIISLFKDDAGSERRARRRKRSRSRRNCRSRKRALRKKQQEADKEAEELELVRKTSGETLKELDSNEYLDVVYENSV